MPFGGVLEQCFLNFTPGSCEHAASDSVGLRWGLRFYNFHQLSDDADNGSLKTL